MVKSGLVGAVVIGAAVAGFVAQVQAQGYNWAGPYAGVNVGYAATKSDLGYSSSNLVTTYGAAQASNFDSTLPGTMTGKGFSGGAQGGYNWQSGKFVYGLEADFNSQRASASRNMTSVPTGRFVVDDSVSSKWMATVRPRVGYAMGSFLVYGTGGVAFTNLKHNHTFVDKALPVWSESDGGSGTKAGYTIGAGLEWGFAKDWTFKTEYLYAQFGSTSSSGNVTGVGAPTAPAMSFSHAPDLSVSTLRAGVNYRF